ncbi:MAG TPA: C45 family peptidase [Sandaracinaceae bacterium]
MEIVRLPAGASARERGRAHGESARRAIREIASIRLELAVAQGKLASEAQVLEVARAHLPVLAAFDTALSEELLGIAEGADLDPARVVVLNHYTDLKDLGPDALASLAHDEDCSAVAARTPAGVVLGQTWDMHGSAAPFVTMLHVPEHEGRPTAWLLSITGCLGMAGMNAAGVGVTINNLKSNDARVGVVWPALVRRMLAERDVEAAKEVLMRAPMSSGHHYLIASAERAYGVETSGALKSVVFETRWEQPLAYVHTNHCLGAEVAAVSSISPVSTTRERYDWLTRSLEAEPLADAMDLWARLGSHDGHPRSVCTHLASEAEPHAMQTCAGILMDLSAKRVWAAPGCIHGVTPEPFDV